MTPKRKGYISYLRLMFNKNSLLVFLLNYFFQLFFFWYLGISKLNLIMLKLSQKEGDEPMNIPDKQMSFIFFLKRQPPLLAFLQRINIFVNQQLYTCNEISYLISESRSRQSSLHKNFLFCF